MQCLHPQLGFEIWGFFSCYKDANVNAGPSVIKTNISSCQNDKRKCNFWLKARLKCGFIWPQLKILIALIIVTLV